MEKEFVVAIISLIGLIATAIVELIRCVKTKKSTDNDTHDMPTSGGNNIIGSGNTVNNSNTQIIINAKIYNFPCHPNK